VTIKATSFEAWILYLPNTEVPLQIAKILIVDDEMIMRESLGGWLERDGHHVEKTASGEEALEILKDSRFDILLVDIKMEGMRGWTF